MDTDTDDSEEEVSDSDSDEDEIQIESGDDIEKWYVQNKSRGFKRPSPSSSSFSTENRQSNKKYVVNDKLQI
mgnify:CR=1 FL=1